MLGNLDEIINQLIVHEQEQKLEELKINAQ
jgi:protein subunit release factor A